jgi:hypothetical protein
LASAITAAYIIVSGTGILDTSGTDYALTTTDGMVVAESSQLYLNDSTCSFTGEDGLMVDYYVEASTGAHTISNLFVNTAGDYTATSGITTVNSVESLNGIAVNFASGATFDPNGGTFTFTRAGTQLLYSGAAAATITFYNIIVNNASCVVRPYTAGKSFHTACTSLTVTAGTWNTVSTDATSRNLTTTDSCNVGDTLICNASTCSFTGTGTAGGFAIEIESSGTFTGGSGAHTVGSFKRANSATAVTFTSGVMTVNNVSSGGIALHYGNGGTFDDGNGTVTFTYAGTQLTYDEDGAARTLYNIIVNDASCVVQGKNAHGFQPLTVANDLTITAGKFDTQESSGGASRGLTVTGNVSITGELDAAASAISAGSLTIETGGTYTATSKTTTITSRDGSNVAWSNSGTFTHSNGKVDFTGQAGTATYDIMGANEWYDLVISVTAACTYRFEDAKLQEIKNSVVMTGASGQKLTITGTTDTAVWKLAIDTGKSQTFTQLKVKWSDASGT